MQDLRDLVMTAELEDLVEYIRNARRIMIFTGAGISTGSGIPDFRGPTAFGLVAGLCITRTS